MSKLKLIISDRMRDIEDWLHKQSIKEFRKSEMRGTFKDYTEFVIIHLTDEHRLDRIRGLNISGVEYIGSYVPSEYVSQIVQSRIR